MGSGDPEGDGIDNSEGEIPIEADIDAPFGKQKRTDGVGQGAHGSDNSENLDNGRGVVPFGAKDGVDSQRGDGDKAEAQREDESGDETDDFEKAFAKSGVIVLSFGDYGLGKGIDAGV